MSWVDIVIKQDPMEFLGTNLPPCLLSASYLKKRLVFQAFSESQKPPKELIIEIM